MGADRGPSAGGPLESTGVPSILVSHPHVASVSARLAEQLAAQGKLADYFTGLAFAGESRLGQVAMALASRRPVLRNRILANLPARGLHSQPAVEMGARFAARVWAGADARFSVYDAVFVAHDAATAWARWPRGTTSVYAYEDGALRTFRRAADQDMTRIWDLPTPHHQTTQEIFRDEARRWPNAALGPPHQEPVWKQRRKESELALASKVCAASAFTKSSLARDRNAASNRGGSLRFSDRGVRAASPPTFRPLSGSQRGQSGPTQGDTVPARSLEARRDPGRRADDRRPASTGEAVPPLPDLWYNRCAMPIIESIPNVSEGRRRGGRRTPGRAVPRALPGCACSTTRPTPRTTDRSSRWPARLAPLEAATWRWSNAAVAADRPAPAAGRASADRRGRRRAVRADRGRDDGGVRGARHGRREQPSRSASACRPTSTRRRRARPVAAEPRGHPPRRIRRAGRTRWPSPAWAPDFGPPTPHPSAGASVDRRAACRSSLTTSTCRPTGSTSRRKIAAAVRHSSGGLRYVKAMGIALADAASCRCR